jgi:hypothetical protein
MSSRYLQGLTQETVSVEDRIEMQSNPMRAPQGSIAVQTESTGRASEQKRPKKGRGPPLTVGIYSAKSIPDCQWFGLQDPYVTVSTRPSRISYASTKYCLGGDTKPVWTGNHRNELEIHPSFDKEHPELEGAGDDDSLYFELKNANWLLDNVIGYFKLELANIQAQNTRKWLPLKGGGLLDVSVRFNDEFWRYSMLLRRKRKMSIHKDFKANSADPLEKVLSVEIHRCANLKSSNYIMHPRLMDPYVTVQLAPNQAAATAANSPSGAKKGSSSKPLQLLTARTKYIHHGGQFPVFAPEDDNMLCLLPTAPGKGCSAQDCYPTLLIEAWNANVLPDVLIGSVKVTLDYERIEARYDECCLQKDFGHVVSVTCTRAPKVHSTQTVHTHAIHTRKDTLHASKPQGLLLHRLPKLLLFYATCM